MRPTEGWRRWQCRVQAPPLTFKPLGEKFAEPSVLLLFCAWPSEPSPTELDVIALGRLFLLRLPQQAILERWVLPVVLSAASKRRTARKGDAAAPAGGETSRLSAGTAPRCLHLPGSVALGNAQSGRGGKAVEFRTALLAAKSFPMPDHLCWASLGAACPSSQTAWQKQRLEHTDMHRNKRGSSGLAAVPVAACALSPFAHICSPR